MSKFKISCALLSFFLSSSSLAYERFFYPGWEGRVYELTLELRVPEGHAYKVYTRDGCTVRVVNRSCVADDRSYELDHQMPECTQHSYMPGSLLYIKEAPYKKTIREGFFKVKAQTVVALSTLPERKHMSSDVLITCETAHFSHDGAILDGMDARQVMSWMYPVFKPQ